MPASKPAIREVGGSEEEFVTVGATEVRSMGGEMRVGRPGAGEDVADVGTASGEVVEGRRNEGGADDVPEQDSERRDGLLTRR